MDVAYNFYGNRSTFEYEFEYVAVFMDIDEIMKLLESNKPPGNPNLGFFMQVI